VLLISFVILSVSERHKTLALPASMTGSAFRQKFPHLARVCSTAFQVDQTLAQIISKIAAFGWKFRLSLPVYQLPHHYLFLTAGGKRL
jgi:hypothetical protein